MSTAESTTQNACRWRFCTETFPTPEALHSHVEEHVAEAAPHPKQERDHQKDFERQHGLGLDEVSASGERPAPHAELSMPDLNRKTGEVEPPVLHPDHPK